MAIGIGLWVLPRTWILLRDTTNVLLEGVPGGIKLPELRAAISGVPGVTGVHDLHVWSMTSAEVNCTAHVILDNQSEPDAVRKAVAAALNIRFGIEHCTIQTEAADEVCEDGRRLHP